MNTAMRLLVAARNGGYRESGATFGSAGARVMVRDWGTPITALGCSLHLPSHLHRGFVSALDDVLFVLLALQTRTHILWRLALPCYLLISYPFGPPDVPTSPLGGRPLLPAAGGAHRRRRRAAVPRRVRALLGAPG